MNINEYFEQLDLDNNIVFITAFDEASIFWGGVHLKRKLGLNANLKYRNSYIAVVDKANNFVYEKWGQEYLKYEYTLPDNKVVKITSAGYGCKPFSSDFIIENTNYSLNAIGLNFFVYNTSEKKVTGTYNCNTYLDPTLTIYSDKDIKAFNDTIKTDNKTVHISALGTCCIRDVIGISDVCKKYEVDRFVQSLNPVSVVSSSPLKKDLNNIVQNLYPDNKRFTNFYRRNFSLDLEKKTLDYISETNAEWLFIDVACLRVPVVKYDNGMFTDFISNLGAQNVIDKLTYDGYLPENGVKILSQDLTDKELFAALDLFIEEILKRFPQEKIFVFEIRPASYCIMKDGTITKYVSGDNYSAVYSGYKYVLSKLPKAHVIEFPINVYGDEMHKWGRFNLHYIKEFYDYCYAAVSSVVFGRYATLEEEKVGLYKLKTQYEQLIYERYSLQFDRMINNEAVILDLNNKLKAKQQEADSLSEKHASLTKKYEEIVVKFNEVSKNWENVGDEASEAADRCIVLSKEKEKLNSELQQVLSEYEKLQENLEDITNRLNILAAEFSDMENSFSFRLGRGITYIPRKIKHLIKK